MAKIQSFTLRDFNELPKSEYHIKVSKDSIFRKCIIVPGSVIAIFEVPDIHLADEIYKYAILDNDQDVPNNSTFIDILEAISENADKEQIVILLPIYKLN